MTKRNSRRVAMVAALVAGLPLCGRAAPGDANGSMQVTTTKTVERFVPEARLRTASIELRPEAIVVGGEVTLKQVCRWPDADADAFAEVADLVVLRLTEEKSFATLSIDHVQSLLRDAGVNPGTTNFAGAASCTVSRSDATVDEAAAMRAWAGEDAAPAAGDVVGSADVVGSVDDATQAALIAGAVRASAVDAAVDRGPPASPAPSNAGDLRARLITDIATRLNLPVDALQVDFRAEDRKFLGLREPFAFTIEPQRAGDLGETSWVVTAASGDQTQRVRIAATARAWQEQLVLTRPLALRQTITDADFAQKRVLADRLGRDPPATLDAAIGRQAARELRVGTVLTAKMLAAPELARAGQLVTVHMRRGNVDVKTVAVALQSGSAGQTIKVKNDATSAVFPVTLTGPQTAVLGASDPVASAAE